MRVQVGAIACVAALAGLCGEAAASVPAPGSSSTLSATSCVAANDCWAVGEYQDSTGANFNQAVHWNGHAWRQVTTPEPGIAASDKPQGLAGVTCTGRRNCWAVGYDVQASGAEANEVFHWNGHSWSQSHTPPSPVDGYLQGVTCLGARNCWAVGGHYNASSGTYGTQELHWNGSRWSSKPGSGIGGLTGVACPSKVKCWAVGFEETDTSTVNTLMRWTGHRWVVSPLSSPSGFESSGVSCSSKRRCLLVGTVYGPGSSHGLAFSWNGHHWSRVSARQTRSAGGLDAVTCVPSGCWAVGSLFAAAYSNWTLRWQHGHWSSVSAPTPAGGSGLLGVSCVLRLSNCWAVGAVGSFSRTNEILHRTGGHWRLS